MWGWMKGIKHKFYSKNIAGRIVMVISALMIVTTACFVISVFVLLQKQLEETTATSARKDLDMVLEKMDLFFEGVENDAVSVLVGESCQTLLENSETFLEGGSLKQHQRYVLIQQVINSYIGQKSSYGAIVFYDLKGNYYANDRLVKEPTYLENRLMQMDDFLQSGEQSMLSGLHKSPWKKPKEKDFADCISYVRKVYSMKTGKLIGAVEMEIPNQVIRQLYETVMSEQICLYFVKDDIVILAGEEELLYQNLAEKRWYGRAETLQADREGFMVTEDRGAWYFLKEYKEQGWMAVSEVSKSFYVKAVIRFAVVLMLIGGLVFLGSLVLVKILVTSITRPLSMITETIVEIGQGNYQKRVMVKDKGEIGTLALEFNRMTEKTEMLLDAIVEKERDKRESELSLIQMQMTPHFFYNILESICGLIVMDEKKQAIRTIQLLSGFYRGVLNKGKEIITIRQEMQIAQNYLEIMKICYPNRFSYSMVCAPEMEKNHICKLTLQPILENAIHHGFREITEGGRLDILVFSDGRDMILQVDDNGTGIDEDTRRRIFSGENPGFQMESFGLRNTDERIKLYFGDDYGLQILTKEHGTRIRIVLPVTETCKDVML